MNTRKIWLLAILFGLLMSFSFFFLTSMNNEASSNESSEESEEQKEQQEEAAETSPNLLNIEPGNRAITIPVDEIQSVSGFVRPGSYVDIISALSNPVMSQILLQNVRVLAVGKTLEDTETETETQEPYTLVTLELNPNDATKLTLARQNGFITLMLRGEDDQEATSNVTISLEQLSKGQMPK